MATGLFFMRDVHDPAVMDEARSFAAGEKNFREDVEDLLATAVEALRRVQRRNAERAVYAASTLPAAAAAAATGEDGRWSDDALAEAFPQAFGDPLKVSWSDLTSASSVDSFAPLRRILSPLLQAREKLPADAKLLLDAVAAVQAEMAEVERSLTQAKLTASQEHLPSTAVSTEIVNQTGGVSPLVGPLVSILRDVSNLLKVITAPSETARESQASHRRLRDDMDSLAATSITMARRTEEIKLSDADKKELEGFALDHISALHREVHERSALHIAADASMAQSARMAEEWASTQFAHHEEQSTRARGTLASIVERLRTSQRSLEDARLVVAGLIEEGGSAAEKCAAALSASIVDVEGRLRASCAAQERHHRRLRDALKDCLAEAHVYEKAAATLTSLVMERERVAAWSASFQDGLRRRDALLAAHAEVLGNHVDTTERVARQVETLLTAAERHMQRRRADDAAARHPLRGILAENVIEWQRAVHDAMAIHASRLERMGKKDSWALACLLRTTERNTIDVVSALRRIEANELRHAAKRVAVVFEAEGMTSPFADPQGRRRSIESVRRARLVALDEAQRSMRIPYDVLEPSAQTLVAIPEVASGKRLPRVPQPPPNSSTKRKVTHIEGTSLPSLHPTHTSA